MAEETAEYRPEKYTRVLILETDGDAVHIPRNDLSRLELVALLRLLLERFDKR